MAACAVSPYSSRKLLDSVRGWFTGGMDVAVLIDFVEVFALPRERRHFAHVRVNPDLGTTCWPNEAGLGPDVLYAQMTGEPLPTFEEPLTTPRYVG
jgi:hypothetical protein